MPFENSKIVLSHPTGNQNVRGVLAGLQQSRLLGMFYTTIGYSRSKQFKWLPANFQREISRKSYELPEHLISTRPLRELVRLLLGRAGCGQNLCHDLGPFGIDSIYRDLDITVGKSLAELRAKSGITGVYGYEDGCEATFTVASSLGMQKYYDLPIAYWQTAQRLLEAERERWPEWKSTMPGSGQSTEKNHRKTRELELSNILICPSKFVAESVPTEKASGKQILIVPFGSPDSRNGPIGGSEKSRSGSLKVLFVGSMSQRKGLAGR